MLASLPALSPTSLQKIAGFSVIFSKISVLLTLTIIQAGGGLSTFKKGPVISA